MPDNKDEITLNKKQLKGLDALSNIDIDAVVKTLSSNKKLSWVGKVFVWIDDNILDHTSRLLMYVLEILGVVAVYMIMRDIQFGFHKLNAANTEMALKKAESYLDHLVSITPVLAAMIATICGALPTIIGVLRSVNNKWKALAPPAVVPQPVITKPTADVDPPSTTPNPDEDPTIGDKP